MGSSCSDPVGPEPYSCSSIEAHLSIGWDTLVASETGRGMTTDDLLEALERGSLTEDQLRELITSEASQLGLTFEEGN